MTFSVGLQGHGTVGASFAELLEERAGAIEAAVGRRLSDMPPSTATYVRMSGIRLTVPTR